MIDYTVPPGYTQRLANSAEVLIVSASGHEQIEFIIDPALERTTGARTTTVGGETAYVLADGASPDGTLYRKVVVVSYARVQYELSCIGYLGYDPATLAGGCAQFTATLRFLS